MAAPQAGLGEFNLRHYCRKIVAGCKREDAPPENERGVAMAISYRLTAISASG